MLPGAVHPTLVSKLGTRVRFPSSAPLSLVRAGAAGRPLSAQPGVGARSDGPAVVVTGVEQTVADGELGGLEPVEVGDRQWFDRISLVIALSRSRPAR